MGEIVGLQFHAEARVERGTAETCACGGQLEPHCGACDLWDCLDCGRQYE